MDGFTWTIAALIGAVVALLVYVLIRRMYRQQKRLRQELSQLRDQQATNLAKEKVSTEGAGSATESSPAAVTGSAKDQVIISYASEDSGYFKQLKVHLSPVIRRHKLSFWSDWPLKADDTQQALADGIARSVLAIVIVSPDYLASNVTLEYELSALVKAQEDSELRLLWLPARPSAVEETELAKYEGLLDPGQPLSTLESEEREIALVTVAELVGRHLDRMQEGRATDLDNVDPDYLTPSFQLVSVRLQNIRCFEDITLDLRTESPTGETSAPSMRTVLVGDNATGKSTLLRSIALGICDESGATALLQAMKGSMVRSGAGSGSIELQFSSSDSEHLSRLVTRIVRSQSGTEIIRKPYGNLPEIIVVGYGTQRSRSGTESREHYDIATAVSSLFDNKAVLQNPDLVFKSLPTWTRKNIRKIVAGMLGLPVEGVECDDKVVRMVGHWGRERLEVLSDGYRSTAQWILDFVNWLIYAGNIRPSPNNIKAIVLIDELEQHLHPQWQRMIMSRLREHMPGVQFLITSHSPLIASSVTGLAEEGWQEKLIYLGGDEKGNIVPNEYEMHKGMKVEQILASPAFDYLIEAEPSVERVYTEASRLAAKGDQRTPEEEDRYTRVKRIVGEILRSQDRTLVEREARADLEHQIEAKLSELQAEVFGDEA